MRRGGYPQIRSHRIMFGPITLIREVKRARVDLIMEEGGELCLKAVNGALVDYQDGDEVTIRRWIRRYQ